MSILFTVNNFLRFTSRINKVQNRSLSFEGRVAIVTGAGRGIGHQYARLLASRGAKVVVNDCDSEQAQLVARELEQEFASCQSVANSDPVHKLDGAENIAKQTLDRYGRIDILINNAGILRDKSFAKMTIEDWDQVINVHLRGSFLVTKACWPTMKSQNYGKIIMTSSTSGLYGNFGQANYSAAKMGLVGLANTLAIEGLRNNIHCNAIVPMADSRMTRDILPAELASMLKPEHIAPLVVWLCHDSSDQTGKLWGAAGQWYCRSKLVTSKGAYLDTICESGQSIEAIAENISIISDFDGSETNIESFADHLNVLLQTIEKSK